MAGRLAGLSPGQAPHARRACRQAAQDRTAQREQSVPDPASRGLSMLRRCTTRTSPPAAGPGASCWPPAAAWLPLPVGRRPSGCCGRPAVVAPAASAACPLPPSGCSADTCNVVGGALGRLALAWRKALVPKPSSQSPCTPPLSDLHRLYFGLQKARPLVCTWRLARGSRKLLASQP